MPTLNSKDGITNFAKKTPAADNLVLSADEHQPKAENYEGDEEEKRKSAPPETTASTSVKTSSIYGFSIVDLLTVSGPSCSRHRRRSATTMISTRKNNEKIKELDEPPIKKTFKSESYDIKEENLHSKPYNDAFLHFHRTDKPSPQYQQPLSTVKQDHQVISLNTTCPSATETAWQQQMNMAATFFIQNQSQKQEIGEAAALERMLALVRGREVLAAFPSFDDRNDQLEELKKKMTAAALLPSSLTNLPNFLNQNNIPYISGNSNRSNEKMLEILAANQQYIMDAQKQQRRQDFLSFLTRAKDDKGEKEGNSPTASRQNSLDEESPAGDESDEGDDCRETSDEEPPSISGVMPSIKSFYSSKSESNTGIRKKKTRTVFSRGQVNLLESAFNAHRYLNSQQRTDLARTLSLTETQVKIWFQNRRNKWKRISGANIDFNEPVENNNDIPTLPPPSTFLFQQHPNFQKNDVSNFSLAYATASHVQNYYEQSSSINNDINNDANNSNPASSSVIPVDNTAINSAIVLQQAQRFLISFLTSSATLQSSSASPPPSVLPPGGKENNASKNFTSTASILSSAVVPEQFTTP